MFEVLEAGWGLDVVMAVQSVSHPLLDALALALNVLGGSLGYLFLLPLVFWSIDRHLGNWLLLVLIAALFGIIGGKLLFSRPRPYVFDSVQVIPLFETEGFGFPSGHVGISLALWGFVALWSQRRWALGVLAVYIVVMAWARMYAGVHYPQDVIGGSIIGGLIAWGIYTNRERLSAFWLRLPVSAQIAAIVLGTLVMVIFLFDDNDGLSGAGILLGGGIGLLLEQRIGQFDSSGTEMQRAIRFVIGMVITLSVFVGLDVAFESLEPAELFRVIRYALVTAVILGMYPIVLARFTQT